MSIEELLLQMEEYRARREHVERRPDWLKVFIHELADHFEPLTTVGRVGFDCQADERGWTVCMYLGTTEIIGGPKDGQIEHASFRMDLHKVVSMFSGITRLEWYSVTNEGDDRFTQETRSVLSVHGTLLGGQFLQLELLGAPPKFVSPGLRQNYLKAEPD